MLEKKKEVGQPVNGVKTAVAKQKTRPQAPITGKGAAIAAAVAAPPPAQPSAGAAQPSSSSSSSGTVATPTRRQRVVVTQMIYMLLDGYVVPQPAWPCQMPANGVHSRADRCRFSI